MRNIRVILEPLKVIALVIYYYFEAFILMLHGGRKNVAGKIVLITGSANGIGREIALNFARLGAILVLWDIDEEGNKDTSELVKKNGALAVYTYKCDLTKREEIYSVADQVRKDVGDVDTLINNAGVLMRKNFTELSDADMEKTVKLNISAHFWTCKAFLPAMIACDSGHLVTISSIGGFIGANKLSDYCASKAAEIGFLESIAFEMWAAGKKGIKTTIICPFFVDTGLITGIKSKNPFVQLLKADYVGQKIVDAIQKEKLYLFLPEFLGLISPKTLLPRKALFLIVEYFGFFTYFEKSRSRIETEK
ncbi:epidermal retinol dehydrogenase 2 [Tiliqua scincoides]|uniref:epidermal retinol dehydrogenase 2 n=1 Tax=Tiliqua scincoides TaxID=71010 RepID=UPI003462B112